ncbi:hypothetical protein [Blastopirellula marina]|uniref:PEP-CTERM protein-sorting domain-containing protein n=1 Tax=Blastopirellula marina TaxID=124 RepID=A0A2S8GNF7_9BACT|nr:hypothetical protein [Blastopirellula marina]PQO45976.1 hypothetical protein C5Y93_12045 [Blastopirellula marina]
MFTSRFSKSSLLICGLAILFTAKWCPAGILLGTTDEKQTSKEYSGYDLVGKIEQNDDGKIVEEELKDLDLEDFQFFVESNENEYTTSLTIADYTRYFKVTDDPADLFVESPFAGFIYNGSYDLQYYAVKSGTLTSMFRYEAGFNVLYTDIDGVEGGSPWVPTSETARKASVAHSISHFTNYGAIATPEPSSMLVLLGFGGLSVGMLTTNRARKGKDGTPGLKS